MTLLFRSVVRQRRRHCFHSSRYYGTFADVNAIRYVRDRGLDHVVYRERNLRPVLNIKNLIKSEPSKSIPLSVITQNRGSLGIQIRPVEFIRKFPSIFNEYFPGGIEIHPHIKLTPEVVGLDAEEKLVYESEMYKQDVADRLLKLLMIGRINKLPLGLIDKLKWDLGLPQDYVKTIVPEFPDYFRVTSGEDSMLELVCWSNELSVPAIEKKATSSGKGNGAGTSIAFPLQLAKGVELDKKYKIWVDEWQKLPYISPYENAMHLAPKSDESDKWAVAVLHEVLNLFMARKAERECLLYLGEYLGLRSRFKRALQQHPGIFYMSGRIGMHTVVLKEAYKRGWLVEKNTLMDIRSNYTHLMHMVKEEIKSKSVSNKRKKNINADLEAVEVETKDDESRDNENDELHGLSDTDTELSDGEDIEERAVSVRKTCRDAVFEDKRPRRESRRAIFEGRRSPRESRRATFNDKKRHSRTPRTAKSEYKHLSRAVAPISPGKNHGKTMHKKPSSSFRGSDDGKRRKRSNLGDNILF